MAGVKFYLISLHVHNFQEVMFLQSIQTADPISRQFNCLQELQCLQVVNSVQLVAALQTNTLLRCEGIQHPDKNRSSEKKKKKKTFGEQDQDWQSANTHLPNRGI